MRVHFIGVGGYGMSGLAEVLQAHGHEVSGCDARENQRTKRLARLGVRVAIGHDAHHVAGQDRVVYSTDVPAGNPELAAARTFGVPILHRSEVLAELLALGKRSVVVTGTHGKTTTTTLITHLLAGSGFDPLGIVGGEIDSWGGGIRLGSTDVVVAEGDESDGSFLRYHPTVAVVTCMEPEHLEHYGMDFERVVEAYGTFLGQVDAAGTAVIWDGEPRLKALAGHVRGTVHLYGDAGGDGVWMHAADVKATPAGLAFGAIRDGVDLGHVFVPLHGLHNVRNVLAALDVALTLGAPWRKLVESLATFANAHRRFEVISRAGDITVVDDYAHHPTEIRAVVAAARELAPGRIIAVFQPQRYVRTKNLWHEFVSAFDQADAVVLTEIYAPAGEERLPGVSGLALAHDIAEHHPNCRYAASLDDVFSLLVSDLRPGDLVLTLGAGDVFRVAHDLRAHLSRPSTKDGPTGV